MVQDEKRYGHPSTSTETEPCQRRQIFGVENLGLTTRDLADAVGV